MKTYSYKGKIITASSKEEAIQKIIASSTLTLYKLIKEKPFKKDYKMSGKFGNGAYFFDNPNMLNSDNARSVYGDIGVKATVEIDDCLDLTGNYDKAVEAMTKKGCSDSVIKCVSSLIGKQKVPFLKIQIIGAHTDDMKKFGCVKYKSPQSDDGCEFVIFDTDKIKSFEYV